MGDKLISADKTAEGENMVDDMLLMSDNDE